MQIYNLTVTNGSVKVNYGYYSLAALIAKLDMILSKGDTTPSRDEIITITVATVQL